MYSNEYLSNSVLSYEVESFCQKYVQSGDAVEAYAQSIRRDREKTRFVHVKGAKKLMQCTEVIDRIKQIETVKSKVAMITRDSILRDIEHIGQVAYKNGQLTIALKSRELLAKALGLLDFDDSRDRMKSVNTIDHVSVNQMLLEQAKEPEVVVNEQ